MSKPDSKTIQLVRLTRLSSRLASHFDSALDKFCTPHELTSAQFRIMAVLRTENGITVAEIARRLITSRQAIQRIINLLVKSGHVQLKDNPAHKRAQLVMITSEGLETLGKIFTDYSKWANETFATISEAQLTPISNELEILLETLGDNLRD